MRKIPIIVGVDGTCTRATPETFRKIFEGLGFELDADAIVWVSETQAEQLMSGVTYASLGYLPNPKGGSVAPLELMKRYVDAKVAYEIRQQAWIGTSFSFGADRGDLDRAEAALMSGIAK